MRVTLNILLAATIAALFSSLNGCSSLDRYQRTYALGYDADTHSGTIGITLVPMSPAAQAVAPPAALNDEVIAKIVKLIMDSKPVTPEAVKVVDFKQPIEGLLK